VEVQPAQQAVRFARGKSFIQAPAHRLAGQARMLGEHQHRAGKQPRVRRAPPLGGFEQAVAIRRASSLPESLRPAPRRGYSLRAASRLPSTKRRLVRYTGRTADAQCSAPCPHRSRPASATSRIYAGLSLHAACLPPLSIARDCVRARLAQL
jgi:hypothetical protein